MVKKEYIVCPLCGRNRLLDHKKKGRAKWPGYELRFPDEGIEPTAFIPEETLILQVREGGGKKPGKSGRKGRGRAPGSGFRLIPEESLTIIQMMKDPDYRDMADGVKRVYNEFKRIGLIKE